MKWECTCGEKITKYDERELRQLVVYAAGIYERTSGKPTNSQWEPCKDVSGLLSQLSNILRGISDCHEALAADEKDKP